MNKVAFFADHIAHWQAGTESQMLMLANGLAEKGWTVPLFVLRDSEAVQDGRWPGPVTELGIASIASPLSWLKAITIARRLRKAGYRLAHLYFNDTSMLLPPLFRLMGIKTVLSRRDMGFWYTNGGLRVLRIVRQFVSAVVTNSAAVAGNVALEERYNKDRISIIYNGMKSMNSVAPQTTPVQSGPVIGILANIRPVKRLDDAIRVLSLIGERFPQAKLRIVGGGDPSELNTLVRQLGLEGRVEFPGQAMNPAVEVAEFTVAMLTSDSEGFSNAVMEYMQSSKPVICTNTGGNPELIEDGITGYLCEVGDLRAMSDRLTALLDDAELRERIGKAASEKVSQLCDEEKMLKQHINLYERLCGEHESVEPACAS
jgi:glycosyltransferase involved in cell wall biosynthesis